MQDDKKLLRQPLRSFSSQNDNCQLEVDMVVLKCCHLFRTSCVVLFVFTGVGTLVVLSYISSFTHI